MITHFAGDDPFADTKLGNALTRAVVDTIPEPFLVLDEDLRILVASRSFYNVFQISKEEVQGQLLYEIGNKEYNIPALLHFLRNIIPEHTILKEYKIMNDFVVIGKRTMLLSAREVFYENSTRKHILLSIGDITGQENLDEAKEKLSQEKDLMIKEMKHRMANSLQLIASVLILKSETVDSLEVRTHLKDAHERIISIATVEKFLDTTSLNEEVEVGPYLTGLCESLAQSIIGTNKPIKLTVEAHGGMTTSSKGISLGLITAELVINALKHAFSSKKTGKIIVRYEVHKKEGWCLSVSDNGVGIPSDPIPKEGLGTVIVQSLARQLGAEVKVETSLKGTTVSIQQMSQAQLKMLE